VELEPPPPPPPTAKISTVVDADITKVAVVVADVNVCTFFVPIVDFVPPVGGVTYVKLSVLELTIVVPPALVAETRRKTNGVEDVPRADPLPVEVSAVPSAVPPVVVFVAL